ncbi:MAG: hypothetical protein ACTS73_07055 [Arsenophonus sp. NEOnobi-MAG3]
MLRLKCLRSWVLQRKRNMLKKLVATALSKASKITKSCYHS